MDMTYCGLYMSTYDNITSYIMLLDVDLMVCLLGDGLLSSSWEIKLGRDTQDCTLDRVVGACAIGCGTSGLVTIGITHQSLC